MSDEFDPKDPMWSDENEAKVEYNNLKFGKPGDWFKGTLTENTRQMKNNLSAKGEMQTVFEFQAHGGSFHNIVDNVVQEEATAVEKGEFWSYITGKPALLNQLKGAKLGQIIGLRFKEIKPSKTKGMNPAKIIQVYLGGMDPDYQGQSANDAQ